MDAGEQVDSVYQTIIKETLLRWQAEVKEVVVSSSLFRVESLVVVSLTVVKAGVEGIRFFFLELF